MATIKDVAEEAGVSITTVSAVINETRYVSPELKEKVNKAIDRLDYRPDQFGRGLRNGRSNTIGLVIPDITNPFFPYIARGVEDCSHENGYGMVLCNTDESPAEEANYTTLLKSLRVDGVIIAPTNKGEEDIKSLEENSIPIVLIDRAIEGLDHPKIVSDNYSGAYEAIEYLIKNGHSKIGFIGGKSGIDSTDKRYQGYLDALEDHGIDNDNDLVVVGNLQVEDSYEATEKLLKSQQEFTALFAANNCIAIGAMQCLKDHSVTYPEEISLVTYDNPPWSSAITPGITAVSQSPYKIGYEAGRRLFELITGSKESEDAGQTVFQTELKVRGSVKSIDTEFVGADS